MRVNFVFLVQLEVIREKLTAIFFNLAKSPIDIIWVDDRGIEQVFESNLAPGEEYRQGTYRNHSWIFRLANTEIRANATANGFTKTFFQASIFGVTPGVNFEDSSIHIYIVAGKIYINSSIYFLLFTSFYAILLSNLSYILTFRRFSVFYNSRDILPQRRWEHLFFRP